MRFTGINDGRVHTPEVVYSLVLDRSGTFETSCRRMVDGMPMMDSSLHAGAYDPHEASHGSWELAGSLLVLKGDAGQYEASIGHFRGGWRIVWAGIEYHMTPDKPSKLFPSRRAG